MIKSIHLLMVMVSIISFIGRIILSETHSQYLKHKAVIILPHAVNGLLILTGLILAFQGQWFSGNYAWIIAKIIVLIGYVGLATLALRFRGKNRWLAFSGAMACFTYIAIVAVTKNPLFFL